MAVEIEIKLAISVDDLEALRRVLPAAEVQKGLRNLYFDTPAKALGAGRQMLRLRTLDSAPWGILCVKGPSENRDGVFRAEEFEWKLNASEVAEFQQDPSTQRARLAPLFTGVRLEELEPFGEIRVRRGVYGLAEGLCLEMDHVSYSDGSEDAELEMEAPESRLTEARDLLDALLQRAGVEASAQKKTKYQRFLSKT